MMLPYMLELADILASFSFQAHAQTCGLLFSRRHIDYYYGTRRHRGYRRPADSLTAMTRLRAAPDS